MSRLHVFPKLLTVLLCWSAVSGAAAQEYPSRPIHMVVPYPPGGVADRLARDVSAELQKRLNQPVIVENKAGAAGNIGFDAVARMPADGYTLLLAPASNLTVQKALFRKLTYDLDRDFAPLSVLVQTPQVLVVHPGIPVNSVAELVEYSKKTAGGISFGMTIGAYQHLASEMLKNESKANFVGVAYLGPGPALSDLLGGHTQFMFTEMMNALEYVKSGKLKAIAVTSAVRVPWMPQVPTMKELGYKDFEVATWYSVVTRNGTPQPIIDKVSSELRAIVAESAFRMRYESFGAFTTGTTPEEMQAFIRKESDRWLAVVQKVGIEPN
jgi:tripartite-type tricarboxylate transporter receptor subunit TctC